MRTSGVILDIYDDTKGMVLRKKLAGKELPAALSEAELLSSEKLASIPDRLFALVAQDGDHTIRKYAMHDAEHVATSILYFLECSHLLPEPAQKVAAVNLLNACGWHDLAAPEPLVKKAFVGKGLGALGAAAIGASTLASAKEGMQKTKGQMDQYRYSQVTGQLPMQGSHVKHATLFEDMMEGTGAATPPGLSKEETGIRKRSDLTGTEMMPAGGSIETKPMRTNTAKRHSNHTESKAAELLPDHWVGPVDITGLEAPAVVRETTYEHFCLPGKYPVDSYEQVKTAAEYFDEHWSLFDLAERRTFALNLVDRANELGVKVAGRALNYAGRTYGRHFLAEMQKRAYTYEGHEHEQKYASLMKEAAVTSPDEMVRAIHTADQASGACEAYGRPVVGFLDPFAAVFGIKTAKEQLTGKDDAAQAVDVEEGNEYVWNMGSDYVTGDQLRTMANRNEELDGVLGKGFSDDFLKDPVNVFKSLPDPQKHVLARLASDNSGGTVRE
jgi:hypothetical protein